MAHFSSLSPDQKWVLVIEMDHTTAWQPCRLVPFDGSSPGRQVGPQGRCTSAAWSPDGNWMYFTVSTASGQHLWRQRFPSGNPEQITSDPADAQGVAMDPDGRSVVTSLGMQQSAIWIHNSEGDRQISSVGDALLPTFSKDGDRVFYLLRRRGSQSTNELWSVGTGDGASERLITGFPITTYDVSEDGSEALLAVRPQHGKSQIWLAPLDRRSPPLLIASNGEETPYFGPDGQILFSLSDGKSNYLYRMNRSSASRSKVVPYPILNVMSVSPDRQWIATLVAVDDSLARFAEIAIPSGGGAARRICSGFCVARWAPNGRFFYVTVDPGTSATPGKTVAIRIPEGQMLPELPRTGIRSLAEGLAISARAEISQSALAPGPDPTVYAYVKTTMHRNLFRIPIR
jgi:Tol biopolymer transport system component